MSLRNNSLAECIRDLTPASADATGVDEVGHAVLEALQEIDTARSAAAASGRAQIAAAQTIQGNGVLLLDSIRITGTAATVISGISQVLTGRPAIGRSR